MRFFAGKRQPRSGSERVGRQLQHPLGDASVGRFSDGEVTVELNYRKRAVQGCVHYPAKPAHRPNDNLIGTGDAGLMPCAALSVT